MQTFGPLFAVAQRIEKRIGWGRIGIVVSVAMVAASLCILWRMLRHIDIHKVAAAIHAMPQRAIMSACIFVVAGYITLTLYDYFALRTIGRRGVPYRTAALASFTSYTIGHNLGATVFTGGAVRLRIYSAWGLGIVDVAKIAFLTGLTFWLGNVFVLGFALAYAPGAATAMTYLPEWAIRSLGLAALLAIAGYVAWLWPRRRYFGWASWQIALPGTGLTVVQIGIGILDFAAGSLAFYSLMPAAPATDFVTLAVGFVSATLLGFVSHAPGSLGIFDAMMLVALAHFEQEELLASLLVFRLVYFMVPFALAVSALGIRELSLARRKGFLPGTPTQDASSA
jgi:uncharacterized membrane protein YbhN (UPF0104 family)